MRIGIVRVKIMWLFKDRRRSFRGVAPWIMVTFLSRFMTSMTSCVDLEELLVRLECEDVRCRTRLLIASVNRSIFAS